MECGEVFWGEGGALPEECRISEVRAKRVRFGGVEVENWGGVLLGDWFVWLRRLTYRGGDAGGYRRWE